MRGYGASGLTRDTEADNWLKIAALSGKMNDEFTEESANMGANALMKGERLPDGMSDAARNQAYLAAPKLEEGAVFETKNNFLKQATEAAKAKGTTVDNILMNPPDDWFKNPMGYKAYASIAKDMSDANLNNGSAIKNYQAANVARFQQFDMSRTYIKDALARGDGDSAAAGLKKLVEESPVPFKLGDYDPQTRTFDFHELDIEKGSVVPASQRVSIDDVLKQTSSIGQAAFVSGATMASIIAKEKNAKSISDPQYFKDKSGKIYTGYTLINPNSLTDTTMHIRDQTTGKEVATLNDPSKLGEMGFSPYDQKHEEGQLKMRYMAEDQNMQKAEHGQRMSFGKEDQEHKRKKWDFEESLYPTKEELLKAKAEKAGGKNRMADDKFSESVIKGLGAGDAPVSSDDQIRALATAKELRSMYDDHVIPTMTSELLPKINAAIASGEKPEDAIRNVAASKAGMPRAFYDLETNKNYTPEQKAEIRKAMTERVSSAASSKTNEDQINSMLEALYSMDTNDVSGYADAAMPSFMYDKENNKAELLYSLGSATGLDIDGLNRLYDEYRRKRGIGASPSIEAENRRTREAFAKRDKIKAYTGKDTGLSMEERFSKMLERNGF